jgi:hypothetical protein
MTRYTDLSGECDRIEGREHRESGADRKEMIGKGRHIDLHTTHCSFIYLAICLRIGN